MQPEPMPPNRPGRRQWLRRVLWLLLALAGASILQVIALRFVDPPFSSVMAWRQAGAWLHGETGFHVSQQWRDLDAMSPQLPLSLIAAEDQRFAVHHGFDVEAICRARLHNERGGRLRGASTISQQTAKNLFLWSGRSWLRKGLEAWYTVLIEALWPKHRILEMYANFAEFGDGVYGGQAAARRFFGVDADQLNAAQCARLAAVLPSPRRYDARNPGPYVQRRANTIERQVRAIGGTAYLRQIE